MSVPLNTRITTTGAGSSPWIQLNRWGPSNYMFNIDADGVGTVTVEGTLVQINRGETPITSDIFDLTGLTAIGVDTAIAISNQPMEFVRVTQTGAGTNVTHIMQGGLTDWGP